MWGQGLSRSDRFASLIATALAAAVGQQPVIAWDRSRSGAPINPPVDPLGGWLGQQVGQPAQFINTFPEIFDNAAQRERFLDGDEGIANNLYGDIPNTFPTVRWQVDNIGAALGRTMEVALVSGGGNDMGLDNLIDPDTFEGVFVTEWDGIIRRIAYGDVKTLLESVRERCPNAVIMYFGYFAPFSYQSDMGKFRTMARHFLDNDLKWIANEVFGVRDTNSILLEMEARSVWAAARAQYWQKTAVNDMNLDPALRGPGVIFVPSGFTQDNSVFGGAPFLNEDYTHPTTDAQQAQREQACVRYRNRGTLRTLCRPFDPSGRTQLGRSEIIRIRNTLTGPTSLRNALTRYVRLIDAQPRRGITEEQIQGRREAWEVVNAAAETDLSRIQRSLIASFVHPNPAGAQRYADIAVERYNQHMSLAAQVRRDERRGSPPSLAGGPETTSDLLRRYRLRGRESLLADIGHLDVDSLGVFAVTARNSDRLLVPNVFLDVITRSATGQAGRRRYQLNMAIRVVLAGTGAAGSGPFTVTVKKFHPEFEPATSHQFTVDPGEPLRLSEITGLAITMGEDYDFAGVPVLSGDHGSVWRPRRIVVELNGHTVHDQTFRNRALAPGQSLRLAYPPRPPTGPVVGRTGTRRGT